MLTPSQWQTLIELSIQCSEIFKLHAGDEGHFTPIGDDGGHTSTRFACVDLKLKTQMRFDPNTQW